MVISASSTTGPAEGPVRLDGPAGALQARVELPERDAGHAAAVVCHPHPLHHGTMDNKVVHTLARACHDVGAPSVRFNFRGVGESDGRFDHGRGELEDALAVIGWTVRQWPDRPLWLLGFSFGGVIAARAAARTAAQRLVTAAPAVTRLELDTGTAPMPPWLVVHGEEDDVVPLDGVIEWFNAQGPGPTLQVLPGVGHFFHGQLPLLRRTVVTFLADGQPEAEEDAL